MQYAAHGFVQHAVHSMVQQSPESRHHILSFALMVLQTIQGMVSQVRCNHFQHNLLQVAVGGKALQPLDLHITEQYQHALS